MLTFNNSTLSTNVNEWNCSLGEHFQGLNSSGNNKYNYICNLNGGTNRLNIAVLGDVNVFHNGPNAADFTEMVTNSQTIVTIRGRITAHGVAAVALRPKSMDGYESYSVSTEPYYAYYPSPNHYDAPDFMTTYLGSMQLAPQLVGNSLVLNWTNPSAVLQQALAAPGPYVDVPGAATPHSVPPTNAASFFRLRLGAP